MPSSYFDLKPQAFCWIQINFPSTARILDVGPGDGGWGRALRRMGFTRIDAVEVYKPYIDHFKLNTIYHHVLNVNVTDFRAYSRYSLVIMGDILEHLTVDEAKDVLSHIRKDRAQVLISVPWQLEQGSVCGNDHEIHQQDDLTPELMEERYPDLCPIVLGQRIGLYAWKQ